MAGGTATSGGFSLPGNRLTSDETLMPKLGVSWVSCNRRIIGVASGVPSRFYSSLTLGRITVEISTTDLQRYPFKRKRRTRFLVVADLYASPIISER